MAVILKFPDRSERVTIRIEGDRAIAQLDDDTEPDRSADVIVERHVSESLSVAQLRAGLSALGKLELKLGRAVRHRWDRWPPRR